MGLDQILRPRPFLSALRGDGAYAAIYNGRHMVGTVRLSSDGLESFTIIPRILFVAAVKAGLLAHAGRAEGAELHALTREGRSLLAMVRSEVHAYRRWMQALEAEVEDLRGRLRQAAAEGACAAAESIDVVAGLESLQMIVMRALQSQHGRVVSRDSLYDAMVAAGSRSQSVKVIDVQIAHIRRRRPDLGKRIRTFWGTGFALDYAGGAETATQ